MALKSWLLANAVLFAKPDEGGEGDPSPENEDDENLGEDDGNDENLDNTFEEEKAAWLAEKTELETQIATLAKKLETAEASNHSTTAIQETLAELREEMKALKAEQPTQTTQHRPKPKSGGGPRLPRKSAKPDESSESGSEPGRKRKRTAFI